MGNYGLIILTPPINIEFMSKYIKNIGPRKKDYSPFYILYVHTTKERGKNVVGESSLKHGHGTKFWKYCFILHHMIRNPQQ